MTRQTTALLTAGPRYTGSFGDRAWRLAICSQLVEGSDPAYWISSPTAPPLHLVEPDIVEVDVPYSEAVVDSILMVLCAHLGDEQIEGLLLDSHLVSIEDGIRRVAPYWAPLADDVRLNLARPLSSYVRVGFTLLDEFSLVNDEVVGRLRALGFDVDVFSLSSSAISAAS